MSVQDMIRKRRQEWVKLELRCRELEKRKSRMQPAEANQFAAMYRNACADLALAESWKLPPSTIDYLQTLVARAHNRLYRAGKFNLHHWFRVAFLDTPRQIFSEPAVHISIVIFWGLSILSGYLAWNDEVWPDFAEQVLGTEQLESFEEMYTNFDDGGSSSATGNAGNGNTGGGRSMGQNFQMGGFYVWNNAGIGLQCFASMVLLLPGLVTLASNAIVLAAVDGYMLRPEMGAAGVNFRNFTTAHGPLELTAIVISAGAGLKIGLAWFWTKGLNRFDSVVTSGRESLPIIMCGVALFIMAAFVEGFISPWPEAWLPWWIKGLVALGTSTMLMFYFVILGFPWGRR